MTTAKYILAKGPLSAAKLQKLCYYAQAWTLVWNNAPLFDEEFQVWRTGPVCPELFAIYKGQHSIAETDIPDELTSAPELTDEQCNMINEVFDYYGGKSAHWLSQLTLLEASWKDAYNGLAKDRAGTEAVSKESIMTYYARL